MPLLCAAASADAVCEAISTAALDFQRPSAIEARGQAFPLEELHHM